VDNQRTIVIGIVAFLTIVFILTSIYLAIHDEKLDYHLSLYGDDIRITPRLLVRILSKDGYLVSSARIAANGRPIEGILLSTDHPFNEITVTIGEKTYRYEIPFTEILDRWHAPPPDDWFTSQELEVAQKAVTAMKQLPRRLYLLPTTIRMFGEVDNHVTLFCMTDTGPCADESVTIDGVPVILLNGVGDAVLPLPLMLRSTARFPDGTSMEISYPYVGKMFSLAVENDHLVLRTLVEAHNVHVDCWRNGRWLFTDIITGHPEGYLLPAAYSACTRIQVSFDSVDPKGNFLVWSREQATESDIADPYYRALLADIQHHRPDMVPLLFQRYPSCRFHRLTTFYSGTELEQRFEEKKRKKCAVVWWLLAITAFSGIVLFTLALMRRLKTVEGETTEEGKASFISLPPRQQKMLIGILVIGMSLFFVFLLSVLRNLA